MSDKLTDPSITDEIVEAAAMALYDHQRDGEHLSADYDWPHIDTAYDDFEDEHSADPEWLRNILRGDARAALAAAVPLLRKAWEQERGQDVYAEVRAERERAHRKHGETSMESSPASDPTGRRYRVLAEEVGEVAREFNDAEHDHRPVDLAALRGELIQVAAMAAAWADACSATSEATQTEGRSVA